MSRRIAAAAGDAIAIMSRDAKAPCGFTARRPPRFIHRRRRSPFGLSGAPHRAARHSSPRTVIEGQTHG
jgi:hypothetical protein